jgi:hypothetical protein
VEHGQILSSSNCGNRGRNYIEPVALPQNTIH